MKIELKNIGTLHKADLEIGDLTLICGENNTGKTYAAYGLYGYLDFMHFLSNNFLGRTRGGRRGIFEIANSYQQCSYAEMNAEFQKHLNQKTCFYAQDVLSQVMAGSSEDFETTEFQVSYNVSLEEIKKAVQRLKDRDENLYGVEYELDDEGFKISIPKHLDGAKYRDYLVDSLIAILMPSPFILSVERTGASIFQEELDFVKINKLEAVQQILKGDKLDILDLFEIHRKTDQRKQIYPKPVRDNINFIRELKQISKQDSFFKQNKEYHKSILDLLGKLVGGKYKITDFGLLFQPKGSKSAYALEVASSSARSLIMLHYYILHVAQKNDILMIDEPELNLHPNNQILVARLLALLVNAGIKVFITTHSDYIVRELSNCIMLKKLNETQIESLKKQGYTQEYGLDAHRVKAYVTKTIKKQNTLIPVKITQEQGIFMQTFDDPIRAQNENQSLIAEKVFQNLRNNHDS
ncbi:AAA family ATPase [Helicobacter mehlei]|uniref:AAA family ATPase n=1 Tax=Helicobacter mehlei TaxID=2316080 RepID=A0A553UNM1_9HELI|nr:AAA family ATPase [Helicobacter mehlei]TSA81829.1 AAA family ATPase [Helicobacter mehlei]